MAEQRSLRKKNVTPVSTSSRLQINPNNIKELSERLVYLARKNKINRELVKLIHYLKSKSLRNVPNAHAFRLSGGLAALMKLLPRCTKQTKNLTLLLGTLGNLCALEQETREMVMNTLLSNIVAVLQTSQDSGVVNTASRILGNLAVDQPSILQIRTAWKGVANDLTHLLATMSDSCCKQSILRTLRTLCVDQVCRAQLRSQEQLLSLADCLKSGDQAVVAAALHTTSVLIQTADPDTVHILCTNGMIPVAMAHLSENSHTPTRYSVDILMSCAQCCEGRAFLGSTGGVEALYRYAQTCRSADQGDAVFTRVVRGVCWCCKDVVSRQRVRDCGALEGMVKMLSEEEFASLHTDILSALICFYFDENTLKFMVRALGLLKALTHHLRRAMEGMNSSSNGSRTKSDIPSSSSVQVDVPSSSSVQVDVPSSSSVQVDVPSSSSVQVDVPSSSSVQVDVASSSVQMDVPSSGQVDTPSSSVQVDVPSVQVDVPSSVQMDVPSSSGQGDTPSSSSSSLSSSSVQVDVPSSSSVQVDVGSSGSDESDMVCDLGGGVSNMACDLGGGVSNMACDLGVGGSDTECDPEGGDTPPFTRGKKANKTISSYVPSAAPVTNSPHTAMSPPSSPERLAGSLVVPEVRPSSGEPPLSKRPRLSLDSDHHTPLPANFIDSLLLPPPGPRSSQLREPPIALDLGGTTEGQVVLLLSRVSHLRDCLGCLAIPEVLVTIVNYFFSTELPNSHCFKVLVRVFMNPHCLQDCVLSLAPSLVYQRVLLPSFYDITQAPQASPSHDITQAPQASPSHDITQAPQASPSHDITQAPQASPSHGITQAPQASPSHDITQAPQASPSHGITQAPQASPSHDITQAPQASPSHDITQAPQASPSQLPVDGPSHLLLLQSLPASTSGLPPMAMGAMSIGAQQRFHSFYVLAQELMEKLSKVAESPYGQGVLAHALLRGGAQEQEASVLAFPLLSHSARFRQKMMMEYGGLDVLIRLVRTGGSSSMHTMAKDSLLLLAFKALGHGGERYSDYHCMPRLNQSKVPPSLPPLSFGASEAAVNGTCRRDVPEHPPTFHYCTYMDTDHSPFDTVAIVQGDHASGVFPVHRSVLVETSEMFAGMFSGHYQESNGGAVTIKGVRPLVFSSVLHFMYGCQWSCPRVMASVLSEEDDVPVRTPTTPNWDILDLEHFSLVINEHYIQAIVSQMEGEEERVVMGHCLRVLACAGRFLLPDLIAACEQYLGTLMCPGVVVPLFLFSGLHGSSYLRTRCIHCLLRMPHTVLKRTVFQGLLDSDDGEEAIALIQSLIVCSKVDFFK